MVQELEGKRQSASFPETAPAANPEFFRTYSRRTEAGLRESYDQVCDRALRGLVELGIVILASDTEHQELKRDYSALQQEHYEIKNNYSQLEQKYSELKEDYQELKDQSDEKDRRIQWLEDEIENYESETDPFSDDGGARCNRRRYDD